MPIHQWLFPLIVFLIHFARPSPHSFGQDDPADSVLAVVNGKTITEGDMAFLMMSRRIPAEKQPKIRSRFLDILIERQLMREFLASRKAEPSQIELDQQVSRIRNVIRRSGDDPDTLLREMGITEKSLRKELALPLTWKSHLRLVVSQKRLRTYYEKHREKFDGTKVRVSQIFLKLPTDADDKAAAAARKQLNAIRTDIEKGQIAFSEAALKYSQAPSKSQGGKTGWIPYRGKLPARLSDAAFALKTGEVSEPIRTPFGMHLVTVTERKPGRLSLEDTRAVVFNHLSQELWRETVKTQRKKAKIKIR